MFVNPELQRYCWSEFSPARMVTPLILIALCGWILLASEAEETAVNTLLLSAHILLWWVAPLTVSLAVNEEVRGNTWDQIRLSALSPWSITWGKMLGCGLYWHYAGLACLLGAAGFVMVFFSDKWLEFGWQVFILLAYGVFLGTSCFLLGTLRAIRLDNQPKSHWIGVGVLPLVLILLCSFSADRDYFYSWVDSGGANAGIYTPETIWNGHLFILSAWALFAAWRVISRLVNQHQIPWAMVAFALYLPFWMWNNSMPGEFALDSVVAEYLRLCITATVPLIYIMLVIDPPTGIAVRRWFNASRQPGLRLVLKSTPAWVSLWLLLWLAVTILMVWLAIGNEGGHILGGGHEDHAGIPGLGPFPFISPEFFSAEIIPWGLMVVLALMVLRDVLIFAWFYKDNAKRALSGVFATLLILYGILPILFAVSFGTNNAVWILPLLPAVDLSAGEVLGRIALAVLQVALAGWFYWRRWSPLPVKPIKPVKSIQPPGGMA